MDRIVPFLDGQDVLILDGGLATRLQELGFDTRGELWSARALVEDQDLIRRVHREYLEAGADCITTSSYQATLPGLVRSGLSELEAFDSLSRSVTLALEAREQVPAKKGRAKSAKAGGRSAKRGSESQSSFQPLIAASVGPFGAYLADGSEYRGDYKLDRRELELFHRPRWRALAQSGADLMAVETIPSGPETLALLELLQSESSPPAWFSFCCRDQHSLHDGTPLAEIVPALDREPGVVAIGVNCIAPELVPGLLKTLKSLTEKPLVVYPNSGELYEDGAWRGGGVDWVDEAPRWVEQGARLIGGCCRSDPELIARLRVRLLGPVSEGSTSE